MPIPPLRILLLAGAAAVALAACLPVGRCHNEELLAPARYRAAVDGRFCFVFSADNVEFCIDRSALPAGRIPQTGEELPARRYTSRPPCTPAVYYTLRGDVL